MNRFGGLAIPCAVYLISTPAATSQSISRMSYVWRSVAEWCSANDVTLLRSAIALLDKHPAGSVQKDAAVRRFLFFFFQAEDGIRDLIVTGVQTCALPISFSSERSETPGASEAGDGTRS